MWRGWSKDWRRFRRPERQIGDASSDQGERSSNDPPSVPRCALACRSLLAHGADPRQGHRAGAGGALAGPRTRVPVSPPWSPSAGASGSRVAAASHRDLRARLLLASPSRMPSRDDTHGEAKVLADEVRAQRRAGSSRRGVVEAPGLVGHHGLGVPTATSRTGAVSPREIAGGEGGLTVCSRSAPPRACACDR